MTTPSYSIPVTEGTVNANGLDIWYVEAGQGSPLLLLHGGSDSNGPLASGCGRAHRRGYAPES
jgi:3-oxoadipate enol-lactonase